MQKTKTKEPTVKRRAARLAYYARNIALDLCPNYLFRRRLRKILHLSQNYDGEYISWRVNYYNKIDDYIELDSDSPLISRIPLKKSMYYYDLMEHGRYFPKHLRLNYVFGDIHHVPARESFLKSRPSVPDNKNGILMKMSKFRLFYIPNDSRPYADKKPLAVWRGGAHNPRRLQLYRKYKDHPLCDVAITAVGPSVQSNDVTAEPAKFLPPTEQMAYRYVICLEGNDVASNLMWTLASNSLCLMPAPENESWAMESRLEPGKHYVRLAPDFGDLEDKILYYERHADEALAIIRNANAHVSQFLDERREQLISILVMYKYFVATRQLEPDPAVKDLIGL